MRFWGGTQDNGTLRKSGEHASTWFDVGERRRRPGARRPDVRRRARLGPSCYVYGTFFGISPYRYTDGGELLHEPYIRNGLDLTDRSDFYMPFVLNQNNPNQLFLGTYRLYRTDNAKDAVGGRRAVEDDQRRPDDAAAPAPHRTARGTARSPRSASAAARPCTPARSTASSTSAPTRRSATTRPGRGSTRTTTCRSGRSRRSPSTGATTGSRTPAFNGFNAATPRQPGHVFRRRTAARSGPTSRATCRTRRSTRSSSTRRTRTRSTPAPTSARS